MNYRDIIGSVKRFWQEASPRVKVLILVGGVTLVVLSFYFFSLSSRVNYDVLFSNLSPQDASAITSKLKEMGESYRLAEGGSAILVPKDKVYELRLLMAGQNLPSGGGVGFEIFDKTSLGTTDFVERINYQRALQGELARTISSLSNVEYARVHIVLPRERLYTSESLPPQAGVVLKLKPGSMISKNEVTAIARLVASSVEGLKPEQVTIVDTNGNLLSRGIFDGQEEVATLEESFYLEVKDKLEKTIEERIQSMLVGILGPNKAIVRASAELDLTQLKTSKEIFSPVVEEKGIVKKEQRLKEEYEGQGAVGGVPGVSSNIPGYEIITGTSNVSTYNKQQTSIDYEVNREVQEILEKPGKIKRLSIAVVVDKELTLQEQNSIRELALAAGGIDLNRGDIVTVQGIPFDRSYYEKEASIMAEEAVRQRNQEIIRLAIIIIGIIIALLILRNIVRVLIKPSRRIEELLPEEVPAPVLEKVPAISPEEQRKREISEEIMQLARRDPQSFVKLLR
ncbi:MAG: flagellar basal-body MS-ring/collar protein FliF, partial [bacterium]|nr:flagellar basal-body MS-ring/collar protein FliF [bacterium]